MIAANWTDFKIKLNSAPSMDSKKAKKQSKPDTPSGKTRFPG